MMPSSQLWCYLTSRADQSHIIHQLTGPCNGQELCLGWQYGAILISGPRVFCDGAWHRLLLGESKISDQKVYSVQRTAVKMTEYMRRLAQLQRSSLCSRNRSQPAEWQVETAGRKEAGMANAVPW